MNRQSHRLDDVISKLFATDEDRAFARAWVDRLESDGVDSGRVEALVRDAAAVVLKPDGTPRTPEEAGLDPEQFAGEFLRRAAASEFVRVTFPPVSDGLPTDARTDRAQIGDADPTAFCEGEAEVGPAAIGSDCPKIETGPDIRIEEEGCEEVAREASADVLDGPLPDAGVRKLVLFDLAPSSCRYPFGDPRRPEEFGFCGATVKKGSPYCPQHHSVCFVPP
jgi:hypothetical protein